MLDTIDFYHPVSIGNVQLGGNLFLAPVAGYSDSAFRYVCKLGGASFAYTEMVSSEALVRSSNKTELLIERAKNEDQYAVQVFGSQCDTMAKSAELIVSKVHPEVIDINAGCPVPKIVKTGAGSALTRDPERLFAVTKAVVSSVPQTIPVTVKIRSGWDSSSLTWKEAALAALEAGAKAITLHARTRAQGYEGKADWSLLAELVKIIDKRIPVFASGDIFSPESVKNVIEQTKCDGVMFARGAMGNPFIFDETKRFLQTGEIYSTPPFVRIKAGLQELDILISKTNEISACKEMRKRFCAYSKGLENGAALRAQIVNSTTKSDFQKLFEPYLEGKTL